MGLIHTPRTAVAISKGLWKRWRNPNAPVVGVGDSNPHIYTNRLGLLDVDYMGHINNAAYLSNAEYARWEMSAENGLIQAMMKSKTHFIVAASAIRYRKEIRPLFSRFTIESTVCGLDDRIIWISQNFKSSGSPRIAAQLLVQGAAIRGREIVNPIHFFKDVVKIDAGLVDGLVLSHEDQESKEPLQLYKKLDDAMKSAAASDDKHHI